MRLLDRFHSSSSFDKGMDVGILFSSSFSKENVAPMLGNLAVRTDLVKVGDAPLLLPMAAEHDINGSNSSLCLAKVIGDIFIPPSPSIVVVNEASMLGKVTGSKTAKTDFAKWGLRKKISRK